MRSRCPQTSDLFLITSGFANERLANRLVATAGPRQDSNFTCAKLSPLARRARHALAADKQRSWARQMPHSTKGSATHLGNKSEKGRLPLGDQRWT
jgi:hypothetical protein